MAGVRDPAFWKRFSTAVHLDEEQAASGLKHQDSWLDRQNRKKSRRSCICWSFWLSFFVLVAGVVGVILWMLSTGMVGSGGDGDGDASSD
ncbi:hypothetical protein AC579_1140 [Pseudocercospora musae]|uniref:Uncharacterized protein n=1 Tax=Pseudocercospora musae TaxID=113226 RepID=A0A139HGT5_9PEZI|nr:hypothetical protein AC579_1140 [Pseudocercospora musae]